MSDDKIHYDLLALEAMRGVIRAVLQRVVKRGLPGDHHFYISFDSQAPGVQISKRLRDQYPEEMTIVIQHQFWDLQVTDDRFEVKLSFNNMPERLVVPFAAIRRFQDPSVEFSLNLQLFDSAARADADVHVAASTDEDNENKEAIAPPPPLPMIADHSGAAKAGSAGNDAAEARKTAEIVKLDSFRKK
jgi:hypothetical protein